MFCVTLRTCPETTCLAAAVFQILVFGQAPKALWFCEELTVHARGIQYSWFVLPKQIPSVAPGRPALGTSMLPTGSHHTPERLK